MFLPQVVQEETTTTATGPSLDSPAPEAERSGERNRRVATGRHARAAGWSLKVRAATLRQTAAVLDCFMFLGIITGRYGSSAPGEPSITHQETRRAVELDKPRWFLVHHNVTIARQLLRQFRSKAGTGWRVRVKGCPILDDVRIIELYDEAIQSNRPLQNRSANWVQPFFAPDDVLRFLVTQFADPARIRSLLSGEARGG